MVYFKLNHNHPEFSDSQVWVNSANQNKSAPKDQSDQGLCALSESIS